MLLLIKLIIKKFMPIFKKKETIVIPPQDQKESFQDFDSHSKIKLNSILFLVLIFILFLGLFILLSYLPIDNSFRILGLLIGSFILEDIFHSFKKILLCLKNN